MQKEWFTSWFDSPYYHILYKNRDMDEAAAFISKLAHLLQIGKSDILLDLACGQGRHAIQLSQYAAMTIGVDLSANSIQNAKLHENDQLQFAVHDMREIYKEHYFTHVFNLFTSFGYFDNPTDNLKMLQSIYQMLLPEGLLVIDFFNSHKVIAQMKAHEKKIQDGILFSINKKVEAGKIIKDISFTDDGHSYNFQEKVQLFNKEEITDMLQICNFEIFAIFGNYNLEPFEPTTADRLIVIAKK